MKKLIPLLMAVMLIKNTTACLNETHTDKYGNRHNRDEKLFFYNEPDKKRAAEFLKEHPLEKILDYDKDMQSDIAVHLNYLGRFDEALAILKRLQKQYPSDYNIAANLGTTFELTGNNEWALFFIKKGLLLNPDSHEGSEWVHVKILEAKIKHSKDPDWLLKNRVLNTGVSFHSKNSLTLAGKIWQIEYQLMERVPFTPFPDKILGNVLDELGDLLATQESMELAYAMYSFSLKYDPADHYGVADKMKQLKPVLIKNKIAIPSWKNYYYNRKLSQLQAQVAEEVVEGIANPDSITSKFKGVQGLIEVFTGNDPEQAARKRKHQRKQTTYIIIGIAVASVIGLGLYKKGKKM